MFSGCRVRPSVRLSVRPDRTCYHDITQTAQAISMKLTGSIHYSVAPTDARLDSCGQRSKVKVTEGRRGSDDAASKSIHFVTNRDVR